MTSWILLVAITALYAGYNLFIKVSSMYVPPTSTTPIAATIFLQLAALCTSLLFALYLMNREGQVLKLTVPAYGWAVVAGLCIGLAEIGYFYIYRGAGGQAPVAANVAVPIIVSGTIAITAIASYLVFKESFSAGQILGSGFILTGIAVIFYSS